MHSRGSGWLLVGRCCSCCCCCYCCYCSHRPRTTRTPPQYVPPTSKRRDRLRLQIRVRCYEQGCCSLDHVCCFGLFVCVTVVVEVFVLLRLLPLHSLLSLQSRMITTQFEAQHRGGRSHPKLPSPYVIPSDNPRKDLRWGTRVRACVFGVVWCDVVWCGLLATSGTHHVRHGCDVGQVAMMS